MNEKQQYKAISKSQRDKEKSLLNIQYTLNTKQGYFDRLLLRDLCDNAKRKANKEVEKMQYLNRHCNINENSEKAKSESMPSGLAGNFACLSLSFLAS